MIKPLSLEKYATNVVEKPNKNADRDLYWILGAFVRVDNTYSFSWANPFDESLATTRKSKKDIALIMKAFISVFSIDKTKEMAKGKRKKYSIIPLLKLELFAFGLYGFAFDIIYPIINFKSGYQTTKPDENMIKKNPNIFL